MVTNKWLKNGKQLNNMTTTTVTKQRRGRKRTWVCRHKWRVIIPAYDMQDKIPTVRLSCGNCGDCAKEINGEFHYV